MAALSNTLTDAIEKAVETHRAEGAEPTTEPVVETTEVAKPEKTEEPEKTKEPAVAAPAVDQDAEQGKLLIQALRDPVQSLKVIDFLAQQAGYTKATLTTKAEVKDAKQDIKEILEAELGDELKFLAPKLGSAIDKILESRKATAEDPSADLRERLDKQELREIQNETARAHTTIAQEYFNSDDMPANVITAMSKAMDDFPPSNPDMTPTTYYRKIFNLVAGELGLQKKASSTRLKSTDGGASLSTQNRGITPDPSGNPKKLTIDEAIRLGVQQVEASQRK